MSIFKFLVLLLCLSLSFFLNCLLELCSNIDFFGIDFTDKKKKNKIGRKKRKLYYLFQQRSLFFVVNSLLQCILGLIVSEIITNKIETVAKNLITIQWKKSSRLEKSTRYFFLFWISIFIVYTTEISAQYFASKKLGKGVQFNNSLLDITYFLIRIFTRFKLIKPKNKAFINTEQETVTFVKNLAGEKIIELGEARLVKAAFAFDELPVRKIMTPYKKTVFFSSAMRGEEMQELCLKHRFTRYPIFDEENLLIGIFNYKMFSLDCLEKGEEKSKNYGNYVTRKILISPTMKLDKAFKKLQKNGARMGIVCTRKRIIGIVTLTDIMETLVGKIKDEKSIITPIKNDKIQPKIPESIRNILRSFN
jgi:CBS domain containing-hemolysin-like protein